METQQETTDVQQLFLIQKELGRVLKKFDEGALRHLYDHEVSFMAGKSQETLVSSESLLTVSNRNSLFTTALTVREMLSMMIYRSQQEASRYDQVFTIIQNDNECLKVALGWPKGKRATGVPESWVSLDSIKFEMDGPNSARERDHLNFEDGWNGWTTDGYASLQQHIYLLALRHVVTAYLEFTRPAYWEDSDIGERIWSQLKDS